MNTAARPNTQTVPPTPRPEVRQAVKELLTRSPAFAQLPAAMQQQTARDTALIADYLAAPEGIEGQKIRGGLGMPTARAQEGEDGSVPRTEDYSTARRAVQEIGKGQFEASGARAGAEAAGLLMKQVNFVSFVSGLIQGVFDSIVKSSIQQMQAYSEMVASVAKSLQQFRDDNVTENQGRDHMVEKFPDLFDIGVDEFADTPQPRLRLRDGVEEGDALRRVNGALDFQDGQLKSMDLSDETAELAIVTAARTQLARQRQQLLASLVLMGISRIVVTDGRLSAKIMYDFQARDTRSLRRSASAYDYARDQYGNLQTTWAGEGEYDSGSTVERSRQDGSSDYSADSYAKGTYKYEQKPVMTAMSAASEASDSVLSTRAQLAGNVEVNFKSDYLPLEKMATPGMIAAIQGNSTPVDPNVVPSARNPQSPGQAGQAQPEQAARPPATLP
ncbi:MAG: hypothetical protein C4563_08575 [Desulfobulbus sp.]|nr:MAG: hypothetical protein C4563_08575 [Desulfobulbus sp.]